ncbi:hypothetical protein DE4585_00735 [Mycobacteroides salmoniphilum]|uniref:Uncharacterized protein n=1 Tax=Mycobacteroides salmoniphilum TaxID=404941 RepID=A0A4V3HYJ5_9MYCO|nr:hypothetical protein DE4586_02224 [Mycobacteroides salmoniphilum]TDZ82402.1 hypothetical protein DE4587_04344 [Mycobacteroides salmoniphilum]TDZ85417.1 hypothetical protein DE4585_00735 [Mycobacteroides salmoniphilum]
MKEHIAGKTFGDSSELGIEPLSQEEIDAANAQLDAFHSRAIDAHQSGQGRLMSSKFWDDTSGTEYEM